MTQSPALLTKRKPIEFKPPVITPANPHDSIDIAVHEIQQLCKISWSEHEIIRKLEEVRDMRRDERGVTSVRSERWA